MPQANMQVVIDGVAYVPAAKPKIGVAITVHNRSDLLPRALSNWRKHLPEGAELVVVDDGSDTPCKDATYRFQRNVGVARAKNKCIELLYDRGIEHFFLADDDIWPVSDDWWRPYVESQEPHLTYTWTGATVFRSNGILGFSHPNGCLMYAERRVVDRVGGLDSAFGIWGHEHVSWSDRIHNAGLTTCRYQDVEDSKSLFESLDQKGKIESSVPESVRRLARPDIAEAKRYSDEYVPFRQHVEDKQTVSLSILVPSIHDRYDTFAPKIQKQLFDQYRSLSKSDQGRVEILMLTDTRSMVLGEKRNQLVRIASGDYVVFVDDDDRLAPDYISSILQATEKGADVITFHARVSLNGGSPKLCRYSLKYAKDENTSTEYHRIPNHICAVKRSLALRTPFPSLSVGEDANYACELRPLLKSEHAIERVLYHYDYNSTTTATQMAERASKAMIERARAPIVDVVILSKAKSEAHRAMTQATIDTCLNGASGHQVNVIVLEQIDGVRYKDAITVFEPGTFAYNAFANKGAGLGTAPWIMIANNDLEFGEGWLTALLSANHQVMSPKNPNDKRQDDITRNELGTVNGRHFSGWCFMMKRTAWEKIGGLDEEFIWWCADDAAIEQFRRVGIKPMLVPASTVKHLTSKTGGDSMPDEMTWGMVSKFEKKYGVKKFENDARYIQWKKKNGL